MVDQLARGAVGQRGVHLVEQILCADELAAQPILQSLQQEAAGQSGLADAGGADEDQILVLGHEVEFGEASDLLALHAGLAAVGKGFQRPALGQIGAADAPLQRALLAVMPLGAQQRGDELRVRDLLLVGGASSSRDRAHAAELEILQQLFDLVSHRDPRGQSHPRSRGRDRRIGSDGQAEVLARQRRRIMRSTRSRIVEAVAGRDAHGLEERSRG